MPADRRIRLHIADDHEVIRQGVKGVVAGTETTVVAEGNSGKCAVRLALENDIAVVLVEVRRQDCNTQVWLKRIKNETPALPVLLFSLIDKPAVIANVVTRGASGFLLKGCTRQALRRAIRAAASGCKVWSSE